MPTSTEYFNEAREALAKASAAIKAGEQEQYDSYWSEYMGKKSLGEKAQAVEAEMKTLQEPTSDMRDADDSKVVKIRTSADEQPGSRGVKLADGRWVPYANEETEGWVKGLPPDCQHKDIVRALGPELAAKADFRRNAFYKWLRKGARALDGDEFKALQEGTDSEGGYAVPTDDVRLPAYIVPQTPGGSIRSISSNFTTTRDAGDWPTITSVSWAATAEEAALPSTTDPVFGQITFSIKKILGMHKVSTELLEDSAVNLPAVINQLYTESLGRYEDQQAIEGDGTTEPQGIRTSGGVDSSGAGLIDASDGWDAGNVVNLFFQLGAQYRDGAAWHTTSTTLARIYALGQIAAGGAANALHFVDGVDGPAMRLMGAPVYVFDGTGWDTTLSGTNEYGCFGNFRLGYYFINRVGMSIRRLDELYAGNDQVGFVARVRYDSRVADNSAFLIMKGEA